MAQQQSAKQVAQQIAAQRAKLADEKAKLDAREAVIADRENELQQKTSDFYGAVQREVDARLGKGPAVRREVRHLELMCPGFGPTDGYGSSAEQIALAMERAGITVSLAGTPTRLGAVNAESIMARKATRGDAIIFYGQPTSFVKQTGRRGYGFSMFEADDIPPQWIPGLHKIDELWVPSEHSAQIFRKHTPSQVDVHVIHLGVDAEKFDAQRRKRGSILKFLHSSTYGSEVRKGADLAIDAFQRAFPRTRTDVSLTIRSTFTMELGKVRELTAGDERIHFVTGQMTTDELVAFLHQYDALLYPSRGEGFGLIPLEAMASGMPAIYPDSTGMHEYASLGLTVSTRSVPSAIGSGRLGASQWAINADWHEPNMDELVAHVRAVDAKYDVIQDRAMEDAATIFEEWSYDRTAEAIKARFEA